MAGSECVLMCVPRGEVESLLAVPAGPKREFNNLVHCSDHAWLLLLAQNAFISKCHRQVTAAFFFPVGE